MSFIYKTLCGMAKPSWARPTIRTTAAGRGFWHGTASGNRTRVAAWYDIRWALRQVRRVIDSLSLCADRWQLAVVAAVAGERAQKRERTADDERTRRIVRKQVHGVMARLSDWRDSGTKLFIENTAGHCAS